MDFKTHTLHLTSPVTVRLETSQILDAMEKELTSKINKILATSHCSFYVDTGVLYGYDDHGSNRGGIERTRYIPADFSYVPFKTFSLLISSVSALATLKECFKAE